MTFLRIRALAMQLLLPLLLLGCASLPPPAGRSTTTAVTDTGETRLGQAAAQYVPSEPGRSGVHPVPDGHEAFAARILVAGAAERSLDVQYYIWHDDGVGLLMFEAMWKAAERGVRVRMLLDDANTKGLDAMLAALDAHPNIEVRLYNPFVQRGSRTMGMLSDFKRLNRRMHNKSFTADNKVSIVGGRNVGDEYYQAGSGVGFVDIDVVAIGPIVNEISSEFDLYWNSASAYPAAQIVGPNPPGGTEALLAQFEAVHKSPEVAQYLDAAARSTLVQDIVERHLAFEWAVAHVVRDDPAKTLADTPGTELLLFPDLVQSIGRPERTLDIVSPYFVPGKNGTAALVALRQRGVRVRILTNSLASSDVTAVHSGYSRRRLDLLRGGVELYELKPTALSHATHEAHEESFGSGGSKAAALHAKIYAVDRSRIFVGSFNFDLRSALLNTEMGIVIESAGLAGQLAQRFDSVVPEAAYEVRLAPDGTSLQWVERGAAGEVVYSNEPGASAWRQLGVSFLGLLPVEWLL